MSLNVSQRLTAILFLTQSLFAAAQIAVFTLLAIVAVELSGRESLAGFPSMTMTFAQALAAYPLGMIMGRFGRRIGLSMGYTLSFVGGILGVFAILEHSFPLLLFSAALMGSGRAGADQSRFAAAEVNPSHLRARMIGRIVFAGTIGAVVGPALVAPSGQIVSGFGLDEEAGPWVVGAIFYGLALLVTYLFLRPEPLTIAAQISQEEATRTLQPPEAPARPLRAILRDRTVQLAIAAMLISQTVMVALMVITPLHMNHHDHGKGEISLVIMAHTLGMFALSDLTGWLIDRYGRINMLIAGALTLILAAVIAPLSASLPVLLTALFLLGLGWNFGYIGGSSLLSEALTPGERARVQGVNDTLVAACAGFGNLSSGVVFASAGYLGVSIMGLLLTLILTGLIGSYSVQGAEQPRQAV